MEECMRGTMRKLALWYTRAFRPIMSHDELDTIMSTFGFVGIPPSGGWKEYVFFSSSAAARGCRSRFRFPATEAYEPVNPPPRPRLPYPQIDGLHIYTYRAFLDALGFYIDVRDISDLFHVRGMPLNRVKDKSRKWRRMEEDESVFVYREGTLEQTTFNLYHLNKLGNDNNGSGGGGKNSNRDDTLFLIRDKGNATVMPNCTVVPLKDIIV